MADYCWVNGVIHFTSPAGWLPVHRDQLQAQRSVTSMGKLYFFKRPGSEFSICGLYGLKVDRSFRCIDARLCCVAVGSVIVFSSAIWFHCKHRCRRRDYNSSVSAAKNRRLTGQLSRRGSTVSAASFRSPILLIRWLTPVGPFDLHYNVCLSPITAANCSPAGVFTAFLRIYPISPRKSFIIRT